MKKLIPLMLLFVIAASSCTFKDIELVKMNDFKVIEFSPENTKAEITVTLKNPNDFAVSITKAKINLQVNGKDIGVMKLDKKIKFPKNSKTTQTFTVIGDYDKIQKELIGNALSIMFSKKLELSGDGFVKGRAMLIGKKVDVSFTETISLDDIDLGF